MKGGLKQLEKEIAHYDRQKLIGEIAAGLAHEIRNPMTVVRGFLQILSSKKEFTVHGEYFNIMIEELDRANSVIAEFLSLAKIRSANLRKKSLNKVIESIIPSIQADACLAGQYVIFDPGDIPDLLLDEKEIRQVVLNLAKNGLEAMTSGGVLTIRTFAEGWETVLSVRDQGKGIDYWVLERIGAPFFTTKVNGTGLGLAVCYSIAARHNATIKFETGPTGTTFFVRFKVIYHR